MTKYNYQIGDIIIPEESLAKLQRIQTQDEMMTGNFYQVGEISIPQESLAKLQRILAQDELNRKEKRAMKKKTKLTGKIIQNMFPSIPIVDDGFQFLSTSELGQYANNPDQERLANNSSIPYFFEQNSDFTEPTYGASGASHSYKTPLYNIFKD